MIADELKPATGSLSAEGTLGHLPQSLPLTGDLTVAEVLGVAAVIRALDAVESGDVGEEHFTTIGDDWDIASSAPRLLPSPPIRGYDHALHGPEPPGAVTILAPCGSHLSGW